MPDQTDAAQPEPFVTVTPPPGRRWVFVGGDEDDAGVTLHVLVAGDGGVTRSYEVRLNLSADSAGDLRSVDADVMEVLR